VHCSSSVALPCANVCTNPDILKCHEILLIPWIPQSKCNIRFSGTHAVKAIEFGSIFIYRINLIQKAEVIPYKFGFESQSQTTAAAGNFFPATAALKYLQPLS